MIVRAFQPSDARQVFELHRDTTRAINGRDYSPEQLDAWTLGASAERWAASLGKTYSCVAVEGDRVLGFGDVTHEGVVRRLYVDKNSQGRGIGKQLLSKLEEVAREKGLQVLTLDSTISAHGFYQAQGYQDVGEGTTSINGVEFKVFSMRKQL